MAELARLANVLILLMRIWLEDKILLNTPVTILLRALFMMIREGEK
jgi:hypothetical protein